MTLRIPFANDAKQYDFGYLRHLAETLLNSEGVANYATDFVVTNAATGLRVDIAAGAAWVKGESGTPAMGLSQGLFSVVNDAAVTNAVTLPAAHATNPRLDQIVLKVRDSADLGSGADDAIFDYVQGTATAGATLLNRTGAAALPNDCLLLADVLVPATATNLTAANVRDRRIPANGRATKYIATSETTTSTSYADLTTPDIADVYVPANGRVWVGWRGIAKSTVADNSRAQIYVIDRQTGTETGLGEGSSCVRTDWFTRSTWSPGPPVIGWPTQGVGGISADQAYASIEPWNNLGNSPGFVQLPGGRVYGFSVRFKNMSAATLTVKERMLNIAVDGNGRSQ